MSKTFQLTLVYKQIAMVIQKNISFNGKWSAYRIQMNIKSTVTQNQSSYTYLNIKLVYTNMS